MQREKLRNHLMFNIISFVVIIFIVMAVLIVVFAGKTIESMTFEKTDNILRIIELDMNHLLDDPFKELNILSEDYNQYINDEFKDKALLVLSQFEYLKRVDILDKDGIVIHSLPYEKGYIGFDLSTSNIYKKISYSNQETIIGEMIINPLIDKPTMYVAQKLTDGYLVGYLNLQIVQDKLKDVIITDGVIAITDEFGTYMSHTDQELVNQRAVDLLSKDIRSGEIKNRSRVDYQGEEHFLHFRKIEKADWYIIYYQKTSNIEVPVQKAIITILLVFIMMLPILVFIIIRIVNILDRSLDKLVAVTRNVAKGNYSVEDEDFYYDEFNRLFQNVKSMSSKVKEREEEVILLNNELETNYYTMVVLLAKAIEAKDNYTGNHCERVRDYSMMLGEAIGLDESDLLALKFGSTLHDIGKLGIPEHILNKPGRFTDDEYEIIKGHSQIGFDIMQEMPTMIKAKQIILHHHERFDGNGYPYGLKAFEIPLLARIVSVADAFDAMTSERPYRKQLMSKKEGFLELRRHSGTQFDSSLIEVFIEAVKLSSIK